MISGICEVGGQIFLNYVFIFDKFPFLFSLLINSVFSILLYFIGNLQ